MFKIILNIFVAVLFFVLYFVINSHNLYKDKPNFINTYYPVGILLCVIVFYFFNKIVLKYNKFKIYAYCFFAVTIFIVFNLTVDWLYGSILKDYYRHSTTPNIVGIINYSVEKGNYISVHKELLKKGIFAHSIDNGYSSNFGDTGILVDDRVGYQEVIYLINYNCYIIYDWSNDKIVFIASKDIVISYCVKYLESMSQYNNPNNIKKTWASGTNITIQYENKTVPVKIYPHNKTIHFIVN